MNYKFKVGDIVRYIKSKTWENKDLGNLALISGVSYSYSGGDTYKLQQITSLPYDQWYTEDQLELVESLESRVKLIANTYKKDIKTTIVPNNTPSNECTCGAKHTSNPNYHRDYCDKK